MTTPTYTPPKRRRGFAAMSPEKRREIAQRGARALHSQGKAHEFTPEEAKAARERQLKETKN